MIDSPWYKTAHRWCQCNLTELDARDCDVGFWREFWKENGIQGIIINAGGTVAYYPSSDPFQYRSKYLGSRDLFGEFVDVARQDGLAVIARMDIGVAHEAIFQLHPDWFARTRNGSPIQLGERYATCINSGYYTERVPKIMSEIIYKYHPDGLADNSWAGMLGTTDICYCPNCTEQFAEHSGGSALPEKPDFKDRNFLGWLKWNIDCRCKLYERYATLVEFIGGPDCVWMGMLFADFYPTFEMSPQTLFCRPYDSKRLRGFSKALVLDAQARNMYFDQNSVNGLALHEVFGDDTLLIESVSCYFNFSGVMLRRAAAPPEEARTWMRAAISAGIVPMPHIIGATQEDKRIFSIAKPVLDWQRDNEAYLFNRENAANVGLVWSSTNYFFFGGAGNMQERVRQPLWGMITALKRRRIGYFPINASQIGEKSDRIKLLILPNVAALSDGELNDIVTFIRNGGSIIYSGSTGSLDDLGIIRNENPIHRFLEISETVDSIQDQHPGEAKAHLPFAVRLHNYLRPVEPRHPIFAALAEAGIIGSRAECLHVKTGRLKPVAFMIPGFPVYPPEFAYMDDDRRVSATPAILAGETGSGGRAVYFAADLDRVYGAIGLPDLGVILSNAIEWALNGDLPFTVDGPGELDCKLYRQKDGERLVLSIVNLSGVNGLIKPVECHYRVGPEQITVRTGGKTFRKVTLQCAGTEIPFSEGNGSIRFEIESLQEQELIIIE